MKQINRATVAAAISSFVLAVPAQAFAEESSNKAEILIPKMAEFIPALIAFLIIWVVLAKFAWPQILSMMDERGKRIQESLDEAETTKKKAIASRKEYDELVTDARRKSADTFLRPARMPRPSALASSRQRTRRPRISSPRPMPMPRTSATPSTQLLPPLLQTFPFPSPPRLWARRSTRTASSVASSSAMSRKRVA